MTVSILSMTLASPFAWLITWESDTPGATFSVYIDGVLAARGSMTEIRVPVSGRSPVIEIRDDAADPTKHPSDRVRIQWRASTMAGGEPGDGIDHYRVEQWVDPDWVEQARVLEEGLGYYAWTSGPLADGQSFSFRVVAVADIGAESTEAELDTLMVRLPDPPAVTATWDAGDGEVTIQ